VKGWRAFGLGLLLSAAACIVEEEPACRGGECSEPDYELVFAQAKLELEREGVQVDPSLWRDPYRFDLLFERMRELAAEQGRRDEVGAVRAPLSSELQKFVDPGVAYCGRGMRPNPAGDRLSRATFPTAYAGACMNHACWVHDRCYETISDLPDLCAWSSQTVGCDGAFYVAYDACRREIGGCDERCEIVHSITLGLGALNVARENVFPCAACKPKACSEFGGQCGAIASCSGVLQCGDCARGEACDYEALVCAADRATPAVPAPPMPVAPPAPPPVSSSASDCCDYQATFDQCGANGLPSYMIDCAGARSTPAGCRPFVAGSSLLCCAAPLGKRC
jgi:hypothetical protein